MGGFGGGGNFGRCTWVPWPATAVRPNVDVISSSRLGPPTVEPPLPPPTSIERFRLWGPLWADDPDWPPWSPCPVAVELTDVVLDAGVEHESWPGVNIGSEGDRLCFPGVDVASSCNWGGLGATRFFTEPGVCECAPEPPPWGTFFRLSGDSARSRSVEITDDGREPRVRHSDSCKGN